MTPNRTMKRQIVTSLYVGLALLGSYPPSASAKYGAAETAVKSALASARDIRFDDEYEMTHDLHGTDPVRNLKRTFICGHVAYKNADGKAVRARFIYVTDSNDPLLAEYGPLALEKPELDYGILDESNGGRYATAFEFSGWNKTCANAQHPKTFSGVAPKSDN